MRSRPTLVFHTAPGREVPEVVRQFALREHLRVETYRSAPEVVTLVNRNLPACVVADADGGEDVIVLCRALKSDAITASVPMIVLADVASDPAILSALEAGADEVLTGAMESREQLLRLQMTLHRADRDVSVHPSTRLPGTAHIERDIADRIRRNEFFAVCYADLDHFKEFNDRYGYNEGDRVIGMLSRILRDIVKARSATGFVGHIGGDDFIFNVPIEDMPICCEEIIEVFDELIPYQYTTHDRRSGYFLGKDRRGNLLRIPIMTLSIGVVTNQNRRFAHTARVSELATEMKSYAKTLPGSVYAVDRRSDAPRVVAAAPSQLPEVTTESTPEP